MNKTLIKSVLLASILTTSGSLYAADNGLIAIITPSHDNPFLKPKPTVQSPKQKSWDTPRWLPLMMMTSINKTN